MLIEGIPRGKYGPILAEMALCWGDELDCRVTVFEVVPTDEMHHPVARFFQGGEAFAGIAGTILERPEEGLCLGVVIGNPRYGK